MTIDELLSKEDPEMRNSSSSPDSVENIHEKEAPDHALSNTVDVDSHKPKKVIKIKKNKVSFS